MNCKEFIIDTSIDNSATASVDSAPADGYFSDEWSSPYVWQPEQFQRFWQQSL
jgi:hypothetical protein